MAMADTPPTTPPTAASVVDNAPPSTDPTTPAAAGTAQPCEHGNEFVESWALAPGGSADPTQAGNRPELSYVSDPGAVIQDTVTLFNYGNVPLTFQLYATDAFNNDQGKFDLLPGTDKPIDAGSWVSFPQSSITVPACKQATVPITIKVPADAVPGDHSGAVIAANASSSGDASGQIVQLDRRTGTRMYIRISGPLHPELAVTGVATTYRRSVNPLGGSAHVTFRLENRGNVRLSGKATVSVAGPFGIGKQQVTLPDILDLLPGQHTTMSADVADVPALMMASTDVRVVPSGADDVGNVKTATGSDLTFTPPLSVLLVLLALLSALLAWRAYRRHRVANEALSGVAHPVQPEPEPQLQS